MRIEPFTVGSYVHTLKRGARGLPITGDESDKYRFLRILYCMNDEFLDENWNRDPVSAGGLFHRPESWSPRRPLANIVAYTLMPNHIHLLLQEIRAGGITAFMQKIGQSMTNHFNEKYDQKGSIFQGPYKSRTISNDKYMRYVSAYIMVKNVFELYPLGGLNGATANFEMAWKWAIAYPFSSLADYCGERHTPIIEKSTFEEIFGSPDEFKSFARDVIMGGKWLTQDFE
ncbi:MAG: transposase [Patescibacteria group bacterium]